MKPLTVSPKMTFVGALLAFMASADAQALSSEQVCQAKKIEASSRYSSCLTDAMRKTIVQGGVPSDEEIARCDRQFDGAFARAEEGADCHTPGGAEAVGNAIKEQVLATFTAVAASEPCATLYVEPGYAVCVLSASLSSIDLQDVLLEINSNPAVTTTVDDDTTILIQAWGGHGGQGADLGDSGNEGTGGGSGYAQITTTVGDISNAYGVTDLHYYLGKKGGPLHCESGATTCAGNGGSATFVTSKDATISSQLPDILLAAAGGGGGGVGNSSSSGGCEYLTGLNGGSGATAISAVGVDTRISGDDGEDRPKHDYSGQGGGSGGNGGAAGDVGGNGSSRPGDDEFAPIGGIGGLNTSATVGFINEPDVVVTGHGGAGGEPGDGPAPGGGGAGGLAAGGGGVEATTKSGCNAGGGGGGSSLARASTRTCKIAPTSKPKNPNGGLGFVQIVISLGGC